MATTPTRPEALIHARGLTKRFGNLVAVDAVDFNVDRGEAFGFLGPNGAGKTSTMRMIGCVSPVSEGELRGLGMNPPPPGAAHPVPPGRGPPGGQPRYRAHGLGQHGDFRALLRPAPGRHSRAGP